MLTFLEILPFLKILTVFWSLPGNRWANLDSNFQIPLFYEISLQENEKHNQRQVLITGNIINNNFLQDG